MNNIRPNTMAQSQQDIFQIMPNDYSIQSQQNDINILSNRYPDREVIPSIARVVRNPRGLERRAINLGDSIRRQRIIQQETDMKFEEARRKMSLASSYDINVNRVRDELVKNLDYNAKIDYAMKSRNLSFESKESPVSQAINTIFVPTIGIASTYMLSVLNSYLTPRTSLGSLVRSFIG